MSERVPVGDGCNGMSPGEAYPADWWPSLSAQLTALDIPGVYVRLDNGSGGEEPVVVIFDHVDAAVVHLKSDLNEEEHGEPAGPDAEADRLVPTAVVGSYWGDHAALRAGAADAATPAAGAFLRISNPTAYDARVCVFVESAADLGRVLSVNAMDRCRRVLVLAGGAVHIPLA